MASSAPPPTIIDLKYAFLRAQIQALSKTIHVPFSFRTQRAADAADQDDDAAANRLRQKSIDDAMFKLNALIRQHSKQVYPQMAQRHVAEQIDSLYWQAGQRDVSMEEGGAGAEGALDKGADLAAEDTIEALPEAWPEDNEADVEALEQYATSVAQLRELNERRRVLRDRVQRYKALQEALAPFKEPINCVQENLCVRNGELEGELERMRMLVARVQGRVEGLELREGGADIHEDLMMVDEGLKLEKLLALS